MLHGRRRPARHARLRPAGIQYLPLGPDAALERQRYRAGATYAWYAVLLRAGADRGVRPSGVRAGSGRTGHPADLAIGRTGAFNRVEWRMALSRHQVFLRQASARPERLAVVHRGLEPGATTLDVHVRRQDPLEP